MRTQASETSFFVGQPLKVLIAATTLAEADSFLTELRQHGYNAHGDFVSTADAFIKHIGKTIYDVILSSLRIADWSGLDLLESLVQLQQNIPCVILAESLTEEQAAKVIDLGADDYVLTTQLQRLPLTVRRLMREQRLRNEIKKAGEEREKLILKLQTTLAEVRRLSGLLPVCISCKRVLNLHGFWSRIEAYIEQNSEARISPSLCPECQTEAKPNRGN